MTIETIPIKSLWTLVRWLPGFLLRLYFTPARLAQLIYVDMVPRGDQANIDLGEAAYFSLNLQVINLSPYVVELDRADFRFEVGGQTLKTSILKKKAIAPGEIATLYMREALPDGHANAIAKAIKQGPYWASLSGNMEFNSKLRPFAKTIEHLGAINFKANNAHARQ